jgi:uncharacterized protein
MRLIPAQDYITRLWKNGGGTTREIITFPAGSGYDTFGWLVSAAHVGQDGPFSIFPGADRSMAILSGTAMALHGLGAQPVTLVPESTPYAFPGDVPLSATLPDGPIEDLNLMTRRSQFAHRMQRLVLAAEPVEFTCRHTVIVFAEHGGLDAQLAATALHASEGDTIVCEADIRLSGDNGARAIVMEIWPV